MKKIGKFIIKGLLGKGGMGRVYKVSHPVTGKIYALKLLDPNPFLVSILGMEEIKKMFRKEAILASSIRHPNVLEIYDYEEDSDCPYYLMEYYSLSIGDMIGETYEAESSTRIMSVDRAIVYMKQLLSGLSALHHKGMVHRDIKPFNILVTEYDQIKICDFGLSKLRHENYGVPEHLKVGSPWYAPPEQEKSPDTVTFNADTYSCGVVFYRILTGYLPLTDEDILKLPSTINPDFDENWDKFFIKSLSMDSSQRFINADEMLHALEELSEHWAMTKDKTCSMSEDVIVGKNDSNGKKESFIRSWPLKISASESAEKFRVDHLSRPIEIYENEFEYINDLIVFDRCTGLYWEKSGSSYSLNYEDTEIYLRELNERRLGGFSDWRLPVVNELITILKPVPNGIMFCSPDVFDCKQKNIWSSDKKSHVAAWYVNFDMGFVWWQDFTAFSHVRAVRKKT